jgi:hypothetical protein
MSRDCELKLRLECSKCGRVREATMCSLKAGGRENARATYLKAIGWSDNPLVCDAHHAPFALPHGMVS